MIMADCLFVLIIDIMKGIFKKKLIMYVLLI